ncbi:hypothetical protein JM654_08255 [Microbacterium oxydans]|nr:hypothetical protein [Microbacterium oxydans]
MSPSGDHRPARFADHPRPPGRWERDYPDGIRALADHDEVLQTVAERIALTIEPVLMVLDPAMIVLGGPTGLAGGRRLAELVAAQAANDEGRFRRCA